jgi:hypothetical protein
VHLLRLTNPHPLASGTPRARWLTALLGAIALSLSLPALGSADEANGSNPNNYECAGHISAGKSETGGEEQPVQYEFLCNGQITGYQLQTQLPVTGIEGSPLLTNFQNQPLTDTFSCSGSFPGYAVNCVGTSTGGPDERITGQFSIGWKLCTEPRVDPLLTVTYAYLAKGVITQAISGPFDLGRPLGCPATPRSGKDRVSAYQGKEPTKKSKGKQGKAHGKRKGKPKHKRTSKSTGTTKNGAA